MTVLLLLACAHAPGETADSADTGGAPDPRYDALRAAVQADLDASLATGASVAVLEHGRIVYAEGFGSADPDGNTPVTPETLFQIGSNSKMYTAAALLRLVDSGSVSLDDTVAGLVPELQPRDGIAGPADTAAVSLHRLLSHQSGFADVLDWAGSEDDAALDAYWSTDFGANAMIAPAGTFWNYSNPNYGLAGTIEERLDADGRAWPDIVEQDILAPLGMDRTYARKSEVEADGDYALSYGYRVTRNGVAGPASVSMEQVPDAASVRPAGLLWSTPSQILRFADFLMHGNTAVLSDESRAALVGEQVNTVYADDEQWYGYGVFVDRSFMLADGLHRVPLWEHGGNTLSMTCAWYVLPDQDWAIAVLSNGYGDSFGGTVTTAMQTLVDVGTGTPWVDPGVDPARLDDFVGSYQSQSNVGPIVITREGDGLRATLPTLDAAGYPYEPVLTPYSTTIWMLTLDGVAYDLTFVGDAGQPATWIRNRSFTAVRTG